MIPAVVQQVLSLAQFSAEAEALLDRLQDTAHAAILEQKATNAQIALYAAVQAISGPVPGTLATYDRLLAAGGDGAYLERVTALWRRALIGAERYSDVAKHVNVREMADTLLARLPVKQPGDASSIRRRPPAGKSSPVSWSTTKS